MINNIKIKNFRGIKDGYIKDFARINLIIGGNNTGKSALMEAIYLATTARKKATINNPYYQVLVTSSDFMGYNPALRVREKHSLNEISKEVNEWFDGDIRVNINSPESPFDSFDLHTQNDFSEEDTKNVSLILINPKEEHKENNIEEIVKNYMGDLFDIPFNIIERLKFFIKEENKLSEALDKLKTFKTEDEVWNYLRNFNFNIKESEPIGKYIESSKKDWSFAFLWDTEMTYNYSGTSGWLIRGVMPKHVIFYDANLVFQHLPLTFYQEKFKEIIGWTRDICKYFSQILNLPKDTNLTFMPVENRKTELQAHIIVPDSPAIPLDSFGDGARLVFKVIAPLTALASKVNEKEEGLFLWEEPELFQNPATLYKLINAVAELTKEKNIQIFITTQSIEVIAYFTELINNKTMDEKDIKAYQLSLKQGELKDAWFTGENLLGWLNNGFDPRIWEEFRNPLSYKLGSNEEEGEE